jgi:hypothetical protein
MFTDRQRRGAVAAQPASGGLQALQGTAAGVRALVQARQAGFVKQGVGDHALPALHAAGQELGDQGVAVAVHNEPRQAVGFAVDQAQAVALDVHAASGADGPGAGLGKKRRVDTLLFVKTPGAYADSGCRAVRAPGEKLAFAGLHPHGFASVGASARDGRIENPGVAA